MSTLRVPSRHETVWETSWQSLRDALAALKPEHPLFGERSIDGFFLMYVQDGKAAFKHVATRQYLRVPLPADA